MRARTSFVENIWEIKEGEKREKQSETVVKYTENIFWVTNLSRQGRKDDSSSIPNAELFNLWLNKAT